MILPLGRYNLGILRNSKKKTLREWLKRLVLQLTTSALLLAILVNYLGRINFNKSTFELMSSSLLFGSIAFGIGFVIDLYRSNFSFLEEHRMTKAEILKEIKETEGSQVTKQQLRSRR